MLLVIDIDEETYKCIKHNVEHGNKGSSLSVIIANGKPLSAILCQNIWEQHINLLKEIYNDKL